MKKITFIYPAIGKKPGTKYIRTWKMEPLPIAALAALTPKDIQLEFFDDRMELIDYETETDLVAITVETYTARRAYDIAARFRQRGIRVVLGGYHPTHLPEEAGQYADSVVVGNAESVCGQLLKDANNGGLKKLLTSAKVIELIPRQLRSMNTRPQQFRRTLKPAYRFRQGILKNFEISRDTVGYRTF